MYNNQMPSSSIDDLRDFGSAYVTSPIPTMSPTSSRVTFDGMSNSTANIAVTGNRCQSVGLNVTPAVTYSTQYGTLTSVGTDYSDEYCPSDRSAIERILKLHQVSEALIVALSAEPWFDKECWDALSSSQARLPIEFLKAHKTEINWDLICEKRDFTEKELSELSDFVNWKEVSRTHAFTKDELRKYSESGKIDFDQLSSNAWFIGDVDEIETYKDRVSWANLSRTLSASKESYISSYGDMPGFDVNYATTFCRDLTEETIIRFLPLVNFSGNPELIYRHFDDDRINCYLKLRGLRSDII